MRNDLAWWKYALMNPYASGVMFAVWPLRFLGIFGTKSFPIKLAKGCDLPWWVAIVMAWTKRPKTTTGVDCLTWFDWMDDRQHLAPEFEMRPTEFLVEMSNGCDVLFNGAPTVFHQSPPKFPEALRELALQPTT